MKKEHGIALVLSLFLMMAMSIVGASLMFLSQTETYSSMNYRLMSQARYGAESGIQRAVNFLSYSYTLPSTSGADLLSNYNTTVSPVTYNGSAVILSANGSQASNYPVAAVQTAFAAAATGTLPAGTTNVTYAPYAKLMAMRQVNVYGGGVQTIQTWSVVSDGTITTGKTAQVEVSATFETPIAPATLYAAFATSGNCGALTFKGSSVTGSYNSTSYNSALGALSASNGGLANSGGNVGTNGNLGESGNATIDGTLSSPRVGVGSCSSGNVDALSSSGHATVTGPSGCAAGDSTCEIVHLPQTIVLPTPTAPTGLPTGTFSGDGKTLLDGASEGDVTVNTGTLTLCSPGATCTINVNSLKFTGNGNITVACCPAAKVILNVAGTGQTTPIDLTGGSVTNSSMAAQNLQILYGGTGTIQVNGNSSSAEMIYAPNAAATLNGNSSFYGSIVTATLNVPGNASLYFDNSLTSKFFTVGNPMMSSFSWKKY
jgi:hypothetical protein